MIRMNITMPESVVEQLGSVKNKSRFIAEAVKEKFNQMQKKKLEQLLMEGYKATAKEGAKINKEWEKATLEGDWE